MPVIWKTASVAALLGAVGLLSGCGSGARASDHDRALRADASRTFVIVLENREYGEVIGSPEMPFLNRLARRGALATRFYAVAHPSLPNYLAMAGGSTFGIDEDCEDCSVGGPNLALQLAAAGITWHAYMADMPEDCYLGGETGRYARRHNPFVYFRALVARKRLCREDVPADDLGEDLARHDLAAFSWLSPNLCQDGHSCPGGVTDSYLRRIVPRILSELGPHGLLVITYDEGASDRGCCGDPGGGHIATILLGGDAPRRARLRHPYDSYSLLAGLEDRFGLPRLRHARGAEPLPIPALEGLPAR